MNHLTKFITENKFCPICGSSLKLSMDFVKYTFSAIMTSIDDTILFIPDGIGILDYSLFEYNIKDSSFDFNDANIKSLLVKHDAYAYYNDIARKMPAL